MNTKSALKSAKGNAVSNSGNSQKFNFVFNIIHRKTIVVSQINRGIDIVTSFCRQHHILKIIR